MQRNIRDTAEYREAEALFTSLRHPGTGQISDVADVNACPMGQRAVFSGTIADKLEGALPTRICEVDLTTGKIRVLSFGPNVDRLPKCSPDGKQVAFLSDRTRSGDFQLYLLDLATGAARATPIVDGWVEYLHWSPDGRHVLLGVAGHGADLAGRQGGVASKRRENDVPSWMPAVDTGCEAYRWRQAWVYELATGRVRRVSHHGCNVWEASWCGSQTLAAVTSPGPDEALWYTARLEMFGLIDGSRREVYCPQDQLGWVTGSPNGKRLAIVEAICSDRWSVAGNLGIFHTESGNMRRVDTRGVDVTSAEWRSEHQLLLAGHRGTELVVGIYSLEDNIFAEVWSARDISTAEYIKVSGLNSTSDCVLVTESFVRRPEIGTILQGEYRTVKSFDLAGPHQDRAIAAVNCISWNASDGLSLQGWLLRPAGTAPHPLITFIHGGPVSHWRPMWLGRRNVAFLMLLERGYAVFFPNPRGSSGRGQDFARHVVGDMGGADTYDCLSGIDYLVTHGIADTKRLGLIGGSYGGFMTSWLVTQDTRFAAAIALSPVTNQVTQHLLSNIPHFVRLFLADTYTNAGGKYFQRSPIMHAGKVRTPTLNICGSLDRCTPPAEAVQFHNALRENGVKSVLLTYSEEGHGVRNFPALIDYTARVVMWFEEHMGAGIKPADDEGCKSPTAKQ